MRVIYILNLLIAASVSSLGSQLDKFYRKVDFSSVEYNKYINHIIDQLPDDPNSEYLKKTMRNSISVKGSEDNFIRWHESYLSFSSDAKNGHVLGLYYSEKNGGHIPFGSIFDYSDSSWKFNNHERLKHSEFQIMLFSAMNLGVMELIDASLEPRDLDHIARFKTLRKLGLPARNLQFSERFELPPNLETLIVRNTVLNNNFFSALNKLKQLRELIILDCSTDLPRVLMDHFELIDKKSTKQKITRPFEKTCEVLQRIKILRSHPLIFDYIVTEEWKVLHNLRVDIYTTTTGFTTMVHPTDGKSSFPALDAASIGISANFKERANEIIPLAKERYPNIIKMVRFVEVGSD
jgi:hypothetical protein